MKGETISAMDVLRIQLPMKRPLIISDSKQSGYEGVLCRLKVGSDIGWGEASPSARVSGETPRTVQRALEGMRQDIIGAEPSLTLIDLDGLRGSKDRCANTALDMALHDLVGHIKGRPVSSFFGSKNVKPDIETSVTVNIGDLDETIKEARMVRDGMGATCFKVKIGTRPNEDIERLKRLRTEFPNVAIRTDANQGYDLETATRVLDELADLDIQFVEQPLPKDAYQDMAELRDRVDVPIMADEMLLSEDDLERIISTGCADMINIKLMKVGGLVTAARMARTAGKAGLGVMVGCMIETGIAITAGTHLSLAMDEIGYTDLDGQLFLEKDIIKGGVVYRRGRNSLKAGPGLGLVVNTDRFPG